MLALQLHAAESERNKTYVDGLEEEEKRRVAAELHDDVLSRLALILNKVGVREGVRGDLQSLSKQVRGLSKTLTRSHLAASHCQAGSTAWHSVTGTIP